MQNKIKKDDLKLGMVGWLTEPVIEVVLIQKDLKKFCYKPVNRFLKEFLGVLEFLSLLCLTLGTFSLLSLL